MQTVKSSILEQILNIGSGFLLSLAVWTWIVAPLVNGEYLSIDDGIYITLIFTVVSFIKGFVWRRIFNRYPIFKAKKANHDN